jgi:hypothetical protein
VQPDEMCRRVLGGRFQIPFGTRAPLRVPSAVVHEKGRHQSDLVAANDAAPPRGASSLRQRVTTSFMYPEDLAPKASLTHAGCFR